MTNVAAAVLFLILCNGVVSVLAGYKFLSMAWLSRNNRYAFGAAIMPWLFLRLGAVFFLTGMRLVVWFFETLKNDQDYNPTSPGNFATLWLVILIFMLLVLKSTYEIERRLLSPDEPILE